MDEKSIFLGALEQAGPARTAYLDVACGDDAALRQRVERLLAVHDDAGSFLESPVLDVLGVVEPNATLLFDEGPTDDVTRLEGGGQAGPPTQVLIEDAAAGGESLSFLEPCATPGRLGRLGPYEILSVIGRGGMGVVLQARDPHLSRVVAVKTLAPEFAGNPTARKRFEREARAAAAVSHPHVVAIHAVVPDGPVPYLVMEYVAGQSLRQKLDKTGPLEVREILRIGSQIAQGLAAAHKQGLIHRDVKPGNVLLENGVERVKLTDFGLARAADDVAITRTGDITGTPQYMSPEQAEGKPVDHRSDLFSLGGVLYAMCTGRPPFRGDSAVAVLRRVCDETPRPIREVNPDVPPWLVDVIDHLLAKDPQHRFQTAQEVADLLGEHLAELQGPPGGSRPKSPKFQRRLPPPSRGPSRWATAALVLLAVLVGLGVTEATGVTRFVPTVIRLVRGDGTLVIEVDDPNVSVTVDGEDVVITGAGPREIRVRPGEYRVEATKDGRTVTREVVTVERGGKRVVRISATAHQPGERTQIAAAPTDRPSEFFGRLAGDRLDAIVRQRVAECKGDMLGGPTARSAGRIRYEARIGGVDVKLLDSIYADLTALLKGTGATVSYREVRGIEARLLRYVTPSRRGEVRVTLTDRSDDTTPADEGRNWQLEVGVDEWPKGESTPNEVIVEFTKDGDGWAIRLDGEPLTRGELLARLNTFAGRNPGLEVWISGDVVPLGPDVRGLMAAITRTGIPERNVKLAPESTKRLLDDALERDRQRGAGEVVGRIALERRLPPHDQWIVAVGLPAADRAVTVSLDGSVNVWDTGSGLRSDSFRLPLKGPASVSPDGQFIAVSQGEDGNGTSAVQLWQVDGWQRRWAVEFDARTVYELGFTPDGNVLLTSNAKAGVALLDAATGAVLWRLPEGAGANGGAAVSPDGTRLFLRTFGPPEDATGRIYRVEDGAKLVNVECPGHLWVTSAAWSPDGGSVITGHTNGAVSVFDADTGRLVRRWSADETRVETVALTPGGVLVTGGAGRIAAWDWTTGRLLATADAPHLEGLKVAVSPDGRRLISGGGRWWDQRAFNSGDFAPRLWRLPESAWPAGDRSARRIPPGPAIAE